jgi:hypothetical protein
MSTRSVNDYSPNVSEKSSDFLGNAVNTVMENVVDPVASRLGIAGLTQGGRLFSGFGGTTRSRIKFRGNGGDDWRVRVSLGNQANIFYRDSSNKLMKPLQATNGVIFPYTPKITMAYSADYGSENPTHSNYPLQFYKNSAVQEIQISGEFTVQNNAEGEYVLAAIYFFRSVSKMFFGTGANAGNPPPIVFLDGLGDHYLPHVPCVLTSFSHDMPNDVDFLEIVQGGSATSATGNPLASCTGVFGPSGNSQLGAITGAITGMVDNASGGMLSSVGSFLGGTGLGPRKAKSSNAAKTRLPTASSISITLRPVYSRSNLHERFDLNKFAAGSLLEDKSKGYGGFI